MSGIKFTEEPKPRIYCPTHTIHLNTSYYTNMTMLDDSKTSVTAYNHYGVNLQVTLFCLISGGTY